jgi:transposase
MGLSDHDLLQLTEKELLELPEAVLHRLSVKLLTDLKEARERLRQTSRNSSRPPSSGKPWDNASNDDQEGLQPQDELSPTNEKPTDDDKPVEPVKKEPGKTGWHVGRQR